MRAEGASLPVAPGAFRGLYSAPEPGRPSPGETTSPGRPADVERCLTYAFAAVDDKRRIRRQVQALQADRGARGTELSRTRGPGSSSGAGAPPRHLPPRREPPVVGQHRFAA